MGNLYRLERAPLLGIVSYRLFLKLSQILTQNKSADEPTLCKKLKLWHGKRTGNNFNPI